MSSSEPLVSFIVTRHNEPEALLRPCVESILALGLSAGEAETIVVDDGSETSAQGWLTALAPGIRYVWQEAQGLSVARNTGIAAARGRYLQFVDADDCLLPGAYTRVLALLRSEAPDLVLFHMSRRARDHAGQSRVRPTDGRHLLLHCNMRAAAQGYVFRRELLSALTFMPGLLHEDELFTPQLLLRARRVLSLDTAPYFYRQHAGTITRATSPEMAARRLHDIRLVLRQLRALGEPVLQRRIRQLTVDYLWQCGRLERDFSRFITHLSWLRSEGFLPLAVRLYSLRYAAVALLADVAVFFRL